MHMHHEPVAPPDAPPAERLRAPRHGRATVVSALLAALILCYWTDLAPTLFGVKTDLVAGVFGGVLVFYSAVVALLSGIIGADVALAIACAASIAIEPITAAVVAFMAFFGEALEGLAARRAHRAISRLVELSPPVAHVQHDDHVHDVPVEQVQVGDAVLVRPGERVPVDGSVLSGESTLDESSLTGESIPVDRGPGDALFAGTLNQLGALTVRAERVGEDTSLGQVIQLVADAQANKGEGERTADRYARRYFLPIVLLAAAGTWLITGQTRNAVAVLVIACPCALVLATPAAVLAGMGRMARDGVIVKGGAVFERLARVTTFAFDKTGTITEGRAAVRRVVAVPGGNEDEALRIAAAAERASEHVFARAIVDEAKRRGFALPEPERTTDFRARPGFGVEATVDGRRVLVGNARLLADDGIAVDAATEALLTALEAEGVTALLVARCAPDDVVGVIGVADTLRRDAHDVLHELSHAGIRHTMLLTGDRRAIADNIASHLHLDDVQAGMLPIDKAEVIRRRQAEGAFVAMVGDGINDAPALAVADVGIAIGGPGRDITADAADVVLMGAPLQPLVLALETSRQTVRIIHQNITVFAIGLNTVAVGLAAAGMLPPMQAAVAHEIGSLAVLLNALRLLGFRRGGRSWIARARHRAAHMRHDAQHALDDLRDWARGHRRALMMSLVPLVLGIWGLTGFRTIATEEVALVRRFGQVVATCRPGLHLRWPWPIESLLRVRPDAVRVVMIGAPFRPNGPGKDRYAVEWETVHPAQPGSAASIMTGDIWAGGDRSTPAPGVPADHATAQMASKLVQISAAVHYAVSDPKAYLLDTRDPDRIVLAAAESVLRELVARYRLDAVLTGQRGALARTCVRRLRERLAPYEMGVKVLSVVLLDVHPDPGKERLNVITAYRDVARAYAEKKERVYAARTEAHQLLAEAQGDRAKRRAAAGGAAARRTAVAAGAAERFNMRRTAYREHPQLERWRLLLKTANEKLAGKRKLILDPALHGRQRLFLTNGKTPLSLTPYLDREPGGGSQATPRTREEHE